MRGMKAVNLRRAIMRDARNGACVGIQVYNFICPLNFPKFAYKKLVWVAFAEVRLSVCVRVFDRRNRMIRYNSHLA